MEILEKLKINRIFFPHSEDDELETESIYDSGERNTTKKEIGEESLSKEL